MVFTDARSAEHRIVYANDSFLELTGFPSAEVVGVGLDSLMARGTEPQALRDLAAGFSGAIDMAPEIHYKRSEGREFWATIYMCPVIDDNGKTIQYFMSFVDITAHKKAEHEAQMLIDELNHRVKNTLAMVQSIVRLAFTRSTEINAIRRSIEDRVFALSRSHDLLNQAEWKNVGLRALAEAVLEPFGVVEGGMRRIELEGEDTPITPKVALAFGIALHELVTNAVKYGALSNDTGAVRLAWRVVGDAGGPLLKLVWQETGGPPVPPPTHRGFGTEVLERGLPLELQGTVVLDFRPEGLLCTIDVPDPGGRRGR